MGRKARGVALQEPQNENPRCWTEKKGAEPVNLLAEGSLAPAPFFSGVSVYPLR